MSGPRSPRQAELGRGEAATWGAHRGAEPTQAERPRMTMRGWKMIPKGSLIGFASIALPSGLEIDDIPVLMTHGKVWATLPARPVISSDGRVAKIPGTGKTQYVSFLRWRDPRCQPRSRSASSRWSAPNIQAFSTAARREAASSH